MCCSVFKIADFHGKLSDVNTMQSKVKEGVWFYSTAMKTNFMPQRNIFLFLEVVGGSKVLSISTRYI